MPDSSAMPILLRLPKILALTLCLHCFLPYVCQVGCKYADENKDDLKDKLDWDTSEYENRQIGGTVPRCRVSSPTVWRLRTLFLLLEFPRPSIGSRVIVCRCWYKVLPAVMKDMADWTTSTRLKVCPSIASSWPSGNSCVSVLFAGSVITRDSINLWRRECYAPPRDASPWSIQVMSR